MNEGSDAVAPDPVDGDGTEAPDATERRRRERDPLARGSIRRSARLATLPLGFAGRATVGLGRRIGGSSAEQVSAQVQQRTAEQLFKVLGELKGGAMKFGQALSLFESVLPDEIAGPYRENLSRLQDSAPPMPTSRVHAVLARELGADWRHHFRSFEPRPAAAASIGQVHRGVWSDGRTVAVKVQYPGADEALRSDLRQISRLAGMAGPLAGGMDVRGLAAELADRIEEELDYTREADNQERSAVAFEDHPEFAVPHVLAHTPRVMVSEWLEGPALSTAIRLPQAERNRWAVAYVRFLFAGPSIAGLLHADPHPGNFKLLDDGRLGAIDFGLVARLPEGLPAPMGRIMRIAMSGDADATLEGLRAEGFITRDVDAQELLDYLAPFVEPAAATEFHFSREWMREQFRRVSDVRTSGGIGLKLNLPPSYLLIHRVWLGGLAVLSQMDVTADFGAVLEEFLPGFAETDA
ncbi:putative unusual protein kinase regulating ubiquinone biosynthesis (AarF/ABC1/UbiB family) [Friedmanniella endophytica]|uniref:Putative unusual protein kinase regulating ubiquinone biosynthesis (AarF/ABC1/UbiB family) n=1 Tax=Microlunatus kandeliicorticis TaxID=1759536 RepID=A0A7W3IUP7_9ACTN|nr:putative unusual protein kinase regulating ubiquinone biosynthesis (AarF/ABC1/UbiB family) [Microlunatus kandeliicorticis]